MQQIQVRFFTENEKYSVPETVVQVPLTLAREGLSEVVNALLARETHINFDFLIDGKFLKTSLEKYLDMNNLSAENILEIKFVEAMEPPTLVAEFPQEDWISALRLQPANKFIAVGYYDNKVKLLNTSGESVAEYLHESPVKAVQWLDDNTLCSGTSNGELFVLKFDEAKNKISLNMECVGHGGAINSIAVTKNSQIFASGSRDNLIHIWNPSNMSSETEPASKKRKGDITTQKLVPTSTFDIHSDSISCLSFCTSSDKTLYSGSWDHSIRSWDIENNSNIRSLNCEKVVNTLDNKENLVLTGHVDNNIRLWDFRTEAGVAMKSLYSGHEGWLSTVKWHSDVIFASASYDGSVRVWDIRTGESLHTMKTTQEKKLLALDWSGDWLFTGGEDKILSVFKCSA